MTTAVALTEIPGVCLRELTVHADERGSFVETYRAEWFPDRPKMLQSNRADSVGGVLRGLHFHRRQADYWYVTSGRILVALADLRPGSPTQGKTAILSGRDQQNPRVSELDPALLVPYSE